MHRHQQLNSTIGTNQQLSLHWPNQSSRNYFEMVENDPKLKFIGPPDVQLGL